MVQVLEDLEIPDGELTFTTSRSSGPGGQNVNKLSTRVTLLFDVDGSASLTPEQQGLLRQRLPGRINKEGILRVVSQRHRTQLANRDAAVRRFADLLREALSETPERIPVQVPERVKERRLEEKRRRGRLKRERAAALNDED
jgi:ribosome-associated protein